MGTFHDGLGELHGFTVVVDTRGPRVVVGRCHELGEHQVVLLDADVHEERPGGTTKEDFLRRTAEVGVWATHRRIAVPVSEVASVRHLSEVPR